MGKRKQKKDPNGKDILAMKIGQKFAETVIKALREYAIKLAGKDKDGFPAIVVNEGIGAFAIISDETVVILDTIYSPVDIIKQVAGDDNDIAWRLWHTLLRYGNELIKDNTTNVSLALLFKQSICGEFILIENDVDNNFNSND